MLGRLCWLCVRVAVLNLHVSCSNKVRARLLLSGGNYSIDSLTWFAASKVNATGRVYRKFRGADAGQDSLAGNR